MKNEEKYKTAEEREKAYKEFCNNNEDCGHCKANGYNHCHFIWLELEADEEQKMLPCPICGCKVFGVKSTTDDEFKIKCNKCSYMSKTYTTASEAIAAHNREAETVAKID